MSFTIGNICFILPKKEKNRPFLFSSYFDFPATVRLVIRNTVTGFLC